MPWLGIIVATLYALEYESRIPTDRPPARSRRLPTPRYSNHVAIQGSITKLSGTTRPRRRRRRPRRAFSPGPTNGSRRAIERPPPPLSICIPHRYAKKECLRHPRHPRTEAISLSRNEAFSSTSAFLRNRTPSREGKGTPSRGEWPYQRFLVSRPGKRNWIDGRTGVGAICVEILESPNSREFQHLYPVKTGTEEKGGEGRGEKIGGRDAWIRTRTHRGTRTS